MQIRTTTTSLLVVIYITTLCNGAPAPSSNEKLLDIKIEEVPDSLITSANKKVAALKETAAQKALAINGLVDTASGTLTTGYTAVTNTFNTGLSAVGQMISGGVNMATASLSPAIESVGRGFTLVSNGVNTGLVSIGDKISEQYANAGKAVVGSIKAAGDLVSEGTALVHNTMTQLGSTVTGLINSKNNAVASASEQVQSLVPADHFFADRPRKIEDAILEQEDFLSKTSSVKDNLQQVVRGIFKPEPVVDNIQNEDEKYGNDGDRFGGIDKAIIGTTEGIAKFFSNLVNFPFQAVSKASKTASSKLNNIGAKLIGL